MKTAHKPKTTTDIRAMMAKIHIAKKELMPDDATYRDVLMRVTGKDSCKHMTKAELNCVIDEFRRLGFVPKQAKNKTAYGAKPRVSDSRKLVLDKIEAILADNKLPWSYAKSMAKQMFKKQAIEWCGDDELYKLMQALAVYQYRHNKKAKA